MRRLCEQPDQFPAQSAFPRNIEVQKGTFEISQFDHMVQIVKHQLLQLRFAHEQSPQDQDIGE